MIARFVLLTAVLVACGAAEEPVAGDPSGPPRADPIAAAAAGLDQAIPEGWSARTLPAADPRARSSEIEMCRTATSCAIPFGGAGATRTETPCVRITLHRLEDEAALHASEEPYRLLSSHCPRDLELARTDALFVAVSPCDRTFAIDPTCARYAEELEAALRAYFAAR